MKHILLRVLWVTVLVYACVMSVWGPSGRQITRQAQIHKHAMLKNLELLTSLNQAYQEQLAALQANPEALALQARSLGYVAPTEVVLRLEKNLVPGVSKMPEIGASLVYVPASSFTSLEAKKIAMLAGAGLLVVLLAWQLLNTIKRRQK